MKNVVSRLAVIALVCVIVPASAFAQSSKNRMRACDDVRRLGSLLLDVQANVNVSSNVWRVVVNEANTRANRVYARTAGSSTARSQARDLRMHVREMRAAALKGDAAGARTHAREALPFATQLATWACD